MNSVEKQLRSALKNSSATSQMQRRVIYKRAVDAAGRIQNGNRDAVLELVFRAIETIENEFEQLVSPPPMSVSPSQVRHEPPSIVNPEIQYQEYPETEPMPTKSYAIYAALLAGFLLLVALAGFSVPSSDTEVQVASQARDTAPRQTSEMVLVSAAEFPKDFNAFAQSRPPKPSASSSKKIPEDTTEINFDINFVSKEFYPVDTSADYFMKLVIAVPEGVPKGTLFPVLNAGFMTFDEKKKPIAGRNRFLLLAHIGRMREANFNRVGNEVTFSGVVLKDSVEQGLRFDPNTEHFRTFISIKMNDSTIPIQLKSLQVQML